jgi:hypothetical protein
MNPARLRSAATRRGALLALAMGFAILFAVSWQKWADLAIDGGREMNAPLRLLRGETIYADVYYLYGPLAPYLNAALYAVLGIHLNTLYLAGTVASLLALLLIFDLGTALTGIRGAALTAWTVLVFCVFKRNGNYIFPYTYSAVYGTVLGLGTVAALMRYIRGSRNSALTLAGVLAGLALICKLEFGFAATAAILAVGLSERPERRVRVLVRALWPTVAIPLVVYGALLAVVPWDNIVRDTYLWPADIPAELIYFNRTKLGLGDPAKTVRELLSAVAMLGVVACAILALSARLGDGSARTVFARLPRTWRVLLAVGGLASLMVLLVNTWVFRTRWDVSPFRALPVLCATLIWWYARPGVNEPERQKRRSLFVLAVYALAVLARVVLRVPSGGAYGSYLLPVPLLLFTHVGMTFFEPVLFAFPRAASYARRTVAVVFTIALTAATVVVAYRYVKTNYVALQTPRGTTKLTPAEQFAFHDALQFIAQQTRPGESLSALPEGSSLNFLGDRPAPLRYEILTPGFLDPAGEQRAIEQLVARDTQFVFLLNRPTTEFGCRAFGRGCYRILMGWIEAHYDVVAAFGKGAGPASEIGDPEFFIKAYRRVGAERSSR